MTDQPARPSSRGYISPPRLAQVGIRPDLSGCLRVLAILASPVVSGNLPLDLRAEWQTLSTVHADIPGLDAVRALFPGRA